MADAFCFNFFSAGTASAQQESDAGAPPEEAQQQQQQQQQEQQQQQQHDDDEGDVLAEEVDPRESLRPAQQQQPAAEQPMSVVALSNGVSLLKGTVSSQQAAAVLAAPELQVSDLVPAKYEGGFKLWEGALDLCNFLIQRYCVSPDTLQQQIPDGPLQGKRVLELGCGHGLPGILCLLAGAATHFQDFNRDVLTSLTMHNVAANTAQLPPGCYRERARFFAGDWQAVGELLALYGLGGHYDVILAAETIYSLESQQRLLGCIKQVLQPPHGVALIAAKSFYFGVGGSTAGFAQLVKDDGVLECSQVWQLEDGISNKREILQLAFPQSIAPFFM